MNEDKNNKLIVDNDEIKRKKIERLYRNQNPIEEDEIENDEIEEKNVEDKELDEVSIEDSQEDLEDDIAQDNKNQNKLTNIQKVENLYNKAKKVKNLAKIGAFITAHWPIFLAGGGILLFIILIIIIVSGGAATSKNKYSQMIGLNGYEYLELENLCEDIYVYNTDNGSDGTYPLEEYIAGVVAAEVGMMNDLTTYEVFAVAARTYALNRLKNSDSCSIEGNENVQAFRPTTDELILEAVSNTKGLVITRDKDLFSTMYDAFCWEEKDDSYYYLCQGNYETGESLKIPIEWANEYVAKWSGQAFLDNPKYLSHGQGMSQHGVYYLSASESWTRDEILTYFYGDDTKLMSIYQTFMYNGEYPINPDDELYQGLQFLAGTSIEELLNSSGSSIEDYNSYLASVVETEGVGTRGAVVGSAVTLIGSLANMGYKLPYQWNGKYYYIGSNPSWGALSESTDAWCNNYAQHYPEKSTCTTNYRWTSFDCSGFVNWAIVNGFKFNNFTEMDAAGAYQITADTNNIVKLNANEAVCLPGDVLYNSGHIMLIVGLDDINKQYIVAESTGSRLNTGYGGVILDYESYGNTKYKCRSLENLYSQYSGGQDED